MTPDPKNLADLFAKTTDFTRAAEMRASGAYPYFRPFQSMEGPEAVLNGRRVTMFGSNNYLGLTMHPKVREAASAAVARYGTSMTGSRFVNGSLELHDELEGRIADFYGRESALVFTTGYQVNLAVCSALLNSPESVAVIDRRAHASIYDGVRLGQSAGARLLRFNHSSQASLERALSKLGAEDAALVMVDGVRSADGAIAPLDELVPVARARGARFFVDDAHGLGVIGPGGRGTAHHLGVQNEVDLIGGTFSKSLASTGGYLVGNREILDYICHFSPSFMFAASGNPSSIAAAMAALEVMQEEEWRMERLTKNYTYMCDELTSLGFEVGSTQTAVVPVYVRDDERTLGMWRSLLEKHDVYTNPFISPGVPPRESLLRTSYMATHEPEHLERGLEAFRSVGREFGLI